MARRIEIELTSTREDGSWTWRAAGAKQPRGTLDGSLLPSEAKAGDVLRAEADFAIDGITVLSVLAPKPESKPEREQIVLLGSSSTESPGVTVMLAGRRGSGRPRPGAQERPPRREGFGPRPPRQSKEPGEPREPRERSRDHEGSEGSSSSEDGHRDGKSDAHDSRARSRSSTPGSRRTRTSPRPPAERRRRAGGGRPDDPEADGRTRSPSSRDLAGEAGGAPDRSAAQRDRQRTHRLNPGRAHRHALLVALAPEEQPVAEQLMRGGIPAVRTALHFEREKAVAEGRPAPNAEELLAMAEGLLPKVKAAEWRDRAEAASKSEGEISLRDLRSVVAGSDLARDEEGRALAASLRELLEARLAELRSRWEAEITTHLDDHRVVKALRLSARPPEPATRLGSDLAARLSISAGEAMAPDASNEQWVSILDAAAESPVARLVKPAGVPKGLSGAERRTAEQLCGRVPALADLLGVAVPPPRPLRRPSPGSRPSDARSTRRPPPRTSGETAEDPVGQEELSEPGS